MQELFSISQRYNYFLFKQILKYNIVKRWQKTALLFFRALELSDGKKNKCAVCAVGFSACG